MNAQRVCHLGDDERGIVQVGQGHIRHLAVKGRRQPRRRFDGQLLLPQPADPTMVVVPLDIFLKGCGELRARCAEQRARTASA